MDKFNQLSDAEQAQLVGYLKDSVSNAEDKAESKIEEVSSETQPSETMPVAEDNAAETVAVIAEEPSAHISPLFVIFLFLLGSGVLIWGVYQVFVKDNQPKWKNYTSLSSEMTSLTRGKYQNGGYYQQREEFMAA